MARIKHFTDNDLDGVTCEILVKAAYGQDTVNCQWSSPSTVDAAISKWISEGKYQFFEKLYITDLSVNEETAKLIDGSGIEVVLLDHHDGANRRLSEVYDWYKVLPEYSGGMLTYLYLTNMFSTVDMATHDRLLQYYEFTRTTEMYDLWTWKDANWDHPKLLNDLYYLIGREEFTTRFITTPSINFNNIENYLLYVNSKRIDKYISAHMKSVRILDLDIIHHTDNTPISLKVAIVPAEDCINELADKILETKEGIDAAMIINFNRSVSVRSRDGKSANLIARYFGGDGHGDASGYPLSESDKLSLIEYVISKRSK